MGDEVIIHAPPDDSPKDSKGRSILKPIERQETRVSRKGIIVTVVAAVLAIGVAVGLGLTGGAPLAARILGAIALAPPLVWAGYAFARDQELEPYRGRELMVRVAVLSAILAALWLVFAWVPTYLDLIKSPAEMGLLAAAIMMAIVLGLGALAAMVVFELEFVGGLTQAGLYFVVTLLLAYLAAVPPFREPAAPPSAPPGARSTTVALAGDHP